MRLTRRFFSYMFVAVLILFSSMKAREANAQGVELEKIKLPEGFRISLYARKVANARSMALGTGGTVFVGTLSSGGGRVYAVRDENGDYKADRV